MAFWHKWFSKDNISAKGLEKHILKRKPDDRVSFGAAKACSKKHISGVPPLLGSENDRDTSICPQCGSGTKPAVFKAVYEAVDIRDDWRFSVYPSRYEFVRWLKKPTGK